MFKVGDKVRRKSQWFDRNWTSDTSIDNQRQVLTVEKVISDLSIAIKGLDGHYRIERFELAERNPRTNMPEWF